MNDERLLLKLSISRIPLSILLDYFNSVPEEKDINHESARDYLSDYVDVERMLDRSGRAHV